MGWGRSLPDVLSCRRGCAVVVSAVAPCISLPGPGKEQVQLACRSGSGGSVEVPDFLGAMHDRYRTVGMEPVHFLVSSL